jgi:hypothetical protein
MSRTEVKERKYSVEDFKKHFNEVLRLARILNPYLVQIHIEASYLSETRYTNFISSKTL